ncbi:MAG: hypothetical protein JWO54_736 [Candidatus Saccharibacteria bacterium]|nr:hypothetical protein [Candidatus Saccharibacteria bacterium]MDB5180973.1 hypothetical protein [Candidatus Saccharibacteria bacterium]
MCEVEFWEVCFFGTRYIGLFNVLPNPTPHYQIVDLESLISLFKLLKNRRNNFMRNRLAVIASTHRLGQLQYHVLCQQNLVDVAQ